MAKLIIIGLQGEHFYKKKLSIFKDKGREFFFKKSYQYFITTRSPPEAVSAGSGADERLIVNLF